jgi:hypothetical protein
MACKRGNAMLRQQTCYGLGLALAATIAAACSATTPPPGGRLTARQQVLATEAIDSALEKVAWPKFNGTSVFVEIGTPAADDERDYLKSAVSAAVAEHGGKLAADAKSADYILLVLGKSVGVDENKTFFGIPSLESSLLPVGLPEIALYLSKQELAVARLQTVLADRRRGGVKARSRPIDSEVWVRDKRVLFFNSHETNSTKVDSVGSTTANSD